MFSPTPDQLVASGSAKTISCREQRQQNFIYLMEPHLRKPTSDRREEQLLLDALGTSKGRW